MKKILLLLLMSMAFQMNAQYSVMDKIIAIVGNEAILLSDIEQQAALMKKQQGALPEDAKCAILDQLLVQNMLVTRAKLDSLELPEGQVDEQLNARVAQILDYMGGDVTQFIEYYGKTPDEVKEDFREDLENQLLAQQMQQQIMASVRVTPSEVVAYFNEIPKEQLPYFNSEVEVGLIEISPKANEQSKQETIDTLEAVRANIMAGKVSFESEAKRISQDLGSKRQGGNLGWAQRGKFVPEFEAIAYNLQENEISEVFETQFGFHVLQLMGRRGNLINTRHILIKPKVQEKDYKRTIQTLDSLKALIEIDSISFEYTVIRHTDENASTKNTGGFLLNQQTGDPIFEVGDLPPEIYFAIDTMKVGQLSTPIKFEDIQTGEVVYKVIKLVSRTDPHVANLKDDYYKIQNAAVEKKKFEFMEEWVYEQIDQIFVKVVNDYDSCQGATLWKKDEVTKPR